jgi:hypothetical protein
VRGGGFGFGNAVRGAMTAEWLRNSEFIRRSECECGLSELYQNTADSMVDSLDTSKEASSYRECARISWIYHLL